MRLRPNSHSPSARQGVTSDPEESLPYLTVVASNGGRFDGSFEELSTAGGGATTPGEIMTAL